MKTCSKCGIERPLDRFPLNPEGVPRSPCKECIAARRRQKYAEDEEYRTRRKEIVKGYQRRLQEAYRESKRTEEEGND